jgi:hypothetical protein
MNALPPTATLTPTLAQQWIHAAQAARAANARLAEMESLLLGPSNQLPAEAALDMLRCAAADFAAEGITEDTHRAMIFLHEAMARLATLRSGDD